MLAGKNDAAERDAFLHVLRAVVDWRGQVVTMTDRAYLALNMPTCVMWGSRDTVLPASQADVARRLIPGVRLEIVPGAGHFPHEEFPDRFVSVLDDFVRTTQSSVYDPISWRGILRDGAALRRPGTRWTASSRSRRPRRPDDVGRARSASRRADRIPRSQRHRHPFDACRPVRREQQFDGPATHLEMRYRHAA